MNVHRGSVMKYLFAIYVNVESQHTKGSIEWQVKQFQLPRDAADE